MPAPLLTTKLYIPPARASRVTRPHLLVRLDNGLRPGRRLILLSAPAGFGKTTLLGEWIALRKGQARFCWLSLDPGDNDPPRFLRYLVAALQTAEPGLGEAAQALLQAPVGAEGLVSTEGVLNALLNDLAAAAELRSVSSGDAVPPDAAPPPLALVLDDYHVIESPKVHEALSYLIDHLPPQAFLVISTRSDPPLPFPRLRARDQVTELRVNDLRFTRSEAADFLNQVMQLDLSAKDVAALEARTEGWAAGLQLASLAVRSAADRASVSSFVEAFAGSNRYVLDYLIEEVLARQPEDVQSFLLQTSMLDRFCSELCSEVVSRQLTVDSGKIEVDSSGSTVDSEGKSDFTNYSSLSTVNCKLSPDRPLSTVNCQLLLEHLERSNLFVVPLDGERRWYRYHNLFAEFLNDRLCSLLARQGESECEERVRELNRRASAWFERQDLPQEAIEYALRAGDLERAAGLIESKARWAVLTPGETGKMLRWLEAIPDEIALTHPGLCLTHAWVLLSAGHNPAAEPYVEAALRSAEAFSSAGALKHPEEMQGSEGGAAGFDLAEIRSEAAAIRSLLAVMAGQLEDAARLAHEALANLPEGELLLRSMVALNLGLAYDMRGDVAAATPIYRQAVALSQAAGNRLVTMIAAVQLADLELLQGQLGQAEESYRQAARLADGLGGLPVTGMAYSGLGHILYEQNRLEEARGLLEKSVSVTQNWESKDLLLISLVYLAQVSLAQGQAAEALALIEQAEAASLSNVSSPSTMPSVRAYMARVWLRAGQVEAAARWAKDFQEQPAGFPQSYLKVTEGATLARVQLALGQPEQAAQTAGRLLAEAHPGESIELKALLALALQAQGQAEAAVQTLQEALTLAAPLSASNDPLQGYAQAHTRLFLDEGAPMARLLKQALSRGAFPAYTAALLDAFRPAEVQALEAENATRSANNSLIEPLSDRELDVLRLVAQGLSNQAVAERLVVAVSTVKTHINNIYGKLGVQSRVQAVTKARELRLIE